jgi:hypothetical protein
MDLAIGVAVGSSIQIGIPSRFIFTITCTD